MPVSSGAIRAGKAFVELALRDSLTRGLRAASARLRGFATGVAQIGAGLSAASAAIVGPLTIAARDFAKIGDQLDKMRARTGVSASALSELGFAAEQGGASIDQLDRSLAAMARFSLMAERGLKTSTDVLDLLGVSLEQFKSAGPEERFLLLADAISKVEDPSVKAGLALQIFGRSGRELLPMLENGRAGIEKLRQEARDLGITLSDEDATAAAQLTDAMNRMRRQTQALKIRIGAALVPALLDLQKIIAPIIKQTIDWVKKNQDTVRMIAAVGTGLGIAGAAFAGFATIVLGVSFAMSALAFIFSPTGALVLGIGALVIGVTALSTWFVRSTDAGRRLAETIGGALKDATDQFGESARIAFDTAVLGNFEDAARLMALQIGAIFERIFTNLDIAILNAVKGFLDAISAIDAAFGSALAPSLLKAQNALDFIIADMENGIEVASAEIKALQDKLRREHDAAGGGAGAFETPFTGAAAGLGGGTFGTFNPAAAARFFGGTAPWDRIADKLDELKEIDRDLLRELKARPGLEYIA